MDEIKTQDTTAAPGTATEASSEAKTTVNDVNVTDKQLVEYLYADLEYEMMDMDLLVKPLEPVMVKKILTELDEKKNKNLKVGQLMHTKQITKEVQASYRKGVILAMGPNVNNGGGYNVSIGDTIVFPATAENRLFDLYRDSIIISKYDIKAKVK